MGLTKSKEPYLSAQLPEISEPADPSWYAQQSAPELRSKIEKAFRKGVLTLDDKLALRVYETHVTNYAAKLSKQLECHPLFEPQFKNDWTGRTIFHYAAMFNNVNAITQLLAIGADINARDRNGDTPIALAAAEGGTEVVEALLQVRASTQTCDNNGVTALMAAAIGGHLSTVRALLSIHAAPSAHNKRGSLFYAVLHGHLPVVALLLIACTDLNIFPASHKPVQLALRRGHTDAATLIQLCDDRETTTQRAWPLCRWCMEREDARKHILPVLVQYLCSRGLEAGLMLAATRAGDCDAIRAFAEAGCDVNAADYDDETPLGCAVAEDAIDVALTLLDAKADVEKTCRRGWSPLSLAAKSGHSDMIWVLLSGNVDIESRDDSGNSALYFACLYNQADVVQVLLGAGAMADGVNEGGNTALHAAVRRSAIECIEVLLRAGADPTIANAAGDHALMAATRLGLRVSVEMLLGEGVSADLMGKGGETPLMVAAAGDYVEVADVLLLSGASVYARDDRGYTPLIHGVLRSGSTLMLKLLLDAGADVNAVCPWGFNAIRHARDQGRVHIITFLSEYM